MKNDKVKCLIVDDEEMATKVIAAHLAHIPDFEVVGVYHSAVEAFLALDSTEVDVLFLDIQMPKVTGLDMIRMLKQKPLTVLTTAHREYAIEGFELEVVDYLMKPIGLQRFLQTISRLKKQLSLSDTAVAKMVEPPIEIAPALPTSSASDHIFIKANRTYHKVDFASILHIEAVKNHIKIVTKKEVYISLVALSEFEQQLPAGFLRIHRSFVVNTQNILKFDVYGITNEQGEIPIGRTYKAKVMAELKGLFEG